MEGPTYVTLSAQVALEQLEVVANNVANVSTSGFKADRQLFQSYVDQLNVPGDSISFVQDRATYIDQTAGPIQVTGNALDVAINGDGYLSVSTPKGTEYTRDGRLQTSADGTLTIRRASRARTRWISDYAARGLRSKCSNTFRPSSMIRIPIL